MKRMIILRMFFVMVFSLLISVRSYSQYKEYGFGLNASTYSGDLARGYNFTPLSFGGTLFYKVPKNQIVNYVFSLSLGSIQGKEKPIDELAIQRRQSFSNFVTEISVQVEYDFWDYKTEDALFGWTPYIFGGVGISVFSSAKLDNTGKIQPVLPFGGGVKFLIGNKVTLQLSAGARKTFTDYIDGLSDGNLTFKNYQYGHPNDKDWYYFTGISISIMMVKVPCPFLKKPNNKILIDK